ncbi:MAG: SRPBCC family protein [Comamonadaceae bacterium]|nr:MAG: SRPBCC family protein [Comamonadaceae bacterium]
MSRVLVQAVRCDWRAAYEFAAEPARMPEWATGLAKGKVSPDAEKPNEWRVDSPTGHARMRVVPRNNFGVLDHWVTPEGLGEVYVPFRVISAGEGRCEFQLTLLRQPTMDDAAFERDSEWIRRDLDSLRRLLERS